MVAPINSLSMVTFLGSNLRWVRDDRYAGIVESMPEVCVRVCGGADSYKPPCILHKAHISKSKDAACIAPYTNSAVQEQRNWQTHKRVFRNPSRP